MIEVRLFATLREGRFRERQMAFAGRAGELLGQLGIEAREVGILLVNGNSATVETLLGDGDAVAVFPRVGGG